MAARERSGIQVIARAVEILNALEQEKDGLSLSDIAVRVGLPRSTVQRIVNALQDEQLLMSASSRGRVKLGSALVRLGRAADIDISLMVRPYIQELSRLVGETVDLSTLRRGAAIFIDQVASSHRLAAISLVGTVFPLHSTANGKALLACLPARQRAKLLSMPMSQDTIHTVTNVKELEKQIEAVQHTGLAYDIEEHTEGVCAVGAAFLDAAGLPYSISIPVPRQRFDSKHQQVEVELLRTCDLITEKFGSPS